MTKPHTDGTELMAAIQHIEDYLAHITLDCENGDWDGVSRNASSLIYAGNQAKALAIRIKESDA